MARQNGHASAEEEEGEYCEWDSTCSDIEHRLAIAQKSVNLLNRVIKLVGGSNNDEHRITLTTVLRQSETATTALSKRMKDLQGLPLVGSDESLDSSEKEARKQRRTKLLREVTVVLKDYKAAEHEAQRLDNGDSRDDQTDEKSLLLDDHSDRAAQREQQYYQAEQASEQRQGQKQLAAQRLAQRLHDNETHDAVLGLERDMRSVAEMFGELQEMMRKQGEVIVSIDDNVEMTATNARRGQEEIRKAEHYASRKRRKRACCIFLIVLAMLLFVVVIVWKFS